MLEAVIDVGTNSALLLVAERVDGAWVARLQKDSICRLGEGLSPGQELSQTALNRMEASLLEFRAAIALVGARLRAVGMTEAVRKASDPERATAVVRRVLGIEPRVLSGDEEAALVRRAIESRYPDAKKLVVLDLGGGSLEIASSRKSTSMPLGGVRMHEMFREKTREALLKHVKQVFKEHDMKRPTYAGCDLVAVGGSATTLVALELAMTEYRGERVEGFPLELELVDKWLSKLDALPVHLRARLPGLSAGRADILPSGLAVLRFSLEFLKPERARVSDLGLRWGLLMDAVGDL
jgi:exopolyphosphatase/guanosine-5'-triphosphate,3'-diphosphate pyrophosphatase